MATRTNPDDPYNLNDTSSLYDQTFGPTPTGVNLGTTEPGGVAGPSASTGTTTESTKIENPASPTPTPTTAPTSTQSNQDRFLAMVNDPMYAGNPQAAIDAFNKLGLSADSSQLSSNYGSSPAYYSNNNTIGLPGAYLTFENGQWVPTQRSPENPTAPAPIQGLDVQNVMNMALPQASTIAPSYYAPPAQDFSITAPKYTPGDISLDDVPNFSYDQLLKDATVSDPTTQGQDALVQNLLANPESLSPQVVDEMKAANKDELANQQAQEDQAAKEMGASYGISDSPWLASERLAQQRGTNEAIVAGNRNIDTQAAQTNFQNKLQAAGVGQGAVNAKNAARQAAVQLASNAALQSAAARGDRMALREQVNQAATQLGLSSDQLMLQMVLGKMADATARNGQQLNFQEAEQRLAEGGREFQEDLMFRLTQLDQQNQQFGATYGLEAAQLENNANNQAYSNYANTFGG